MSKHLNIPKLDMRAALNASTFSDEERSVEVTFSTGAAVKRNSFFGMGEDYYQELSMKPAAVDLKRFKLGAPVLNSHRSDDIASVIGVVESARVENGEGVARIKFSTRADVAPIIEDVKNGILRNISVGFVIHRNEESDEKRDGLTVFNATKWEPYELSLVPIPADAGAQIRSAEETFSCEVIRSGDKPAEDKPAEETPEVKEPGEEPAQVAAETTGQPQPSEIGSERSDDDINGEHGAAVTRETFLETEMPEKRENGAAENLDAVKTEAVKAERLRCSEIRAAVKQAKLGETLTEELIDNGVSANEARKLVLEKLAAKDKETATRSANIEVGQDNTAEGVKKGITEAILARTNPSKHDHTTESARFKYKNLLSLTEASLNARGVKTDSMSPMEIATRGLHSTSDFPEILANVANKTLRDAYQESPVTWEPVVRRTTTSDFKEITRAQLGDAPKLKERLETGEYEYGSISESAEKYSVKDYGRVVAVSRKLLINDDLNAFTRLPEMYGRQARNLESDLIWAIVTGNPLMADGNALFSSAHGNLAGSGSAIDVASLGEAREAMRLQTSLDGSKLNIRPRYMYVPAALETKADQVTVQTTPDQASTVNPFAAGGRSALIAAAEPRLDDDSSTAWYLMADAGQVDLFEMAFLTGEEGPVVDSMIDFDTDGVKFKARHTVGVKAIDWRGMFKNPGA